MEFSGCRRARRRCESFFTLVLTTWDKTTWFEASNTTHRRETHAIVWGALFGLPKGAVGSTCVASLVARCPTLGNAAVAPRLPRLIRIAQARSQSYPRCRRLQAGVLRPGVSHPSIDLRLADANRLQDAATPSSNGILHVRRCINDSEARNSKQRQWVTQWGNKEQSGSGHS